MKRRKFISVNASVAAGSAMLGNYAGAETTGKKIREKAKDIEVIDSLISLCLAEARRDVLLPLRRDGLA